jgi:membrane protease YdiL (CAAX protease family)
MEKTNSHTTFSLTLAWVMTLVTTILPEVLLKEALKMPVPGWLIWFKIGFLAAIFVSGFFFGRLRLPQKYSLILIALLLLEQASSWVGQSHWWKSLFTGEGFIVTMASQQILRLIAAFITIGLMLILFKNFSAFFVIKGDLKATAAPLPLIMTRSTSWAKLGWILVLCISGGTLVFLIIGAGSALAQVQKVLPFLPFILLFALMNSFSEEIGYRANLLAALTPEFGRDDALLMSAALFGMQHYYGVPYGVIGVIMAGILGWLLGKSMVETKGIVWAWTIHFCQDVLIFTFLAVGSIAAGG